MNIDNTQLIKEANDILQDLAMNGREAKDNFITKFGTSLENYVKRYVREEAFSEKLLVNKTMSPKDPGIQETEDADVFYVLDKKEIGATAAEVSIRGDTQPIFVDTKKYKIWIGKIETERHKKPWLELETSSASDLVDMVTKNGAEAIRRTQDLGFIKNVASILTITGNHVGGDTTVYTDTIDWTNSGRKKDLTNLMSYITRQGLVPAKWLMSQTAWNDMLAFDAGEVGNLAGETFKNGIAQKVLLDIPVITTIKADLKNDDETIYYFDKEGDSGELYTDIYLFVDPSYLGKNIKIGSDKSDSKWEWDDFIWGAWRYTGHGFGDTRGICRMRIRIK